jgi:hypothetical protein
MIAQKLIFAKCINRDPFSKCSFCMIVSKDYKKPVPQCMAVVLECSGLARHLLACSGLTGSPADQRHGLVSKQLPFSWLAVTSTSQHSALPLPRSAHGPVEVPAARGAMLSCIRMAPISTVPRAFSLQDGVPIGLLYGITVSACRGCVSSTIALVPWLEQNWMCSRHGRVDPPAPSVPTERKARSPMKACCTQLQA